MKPQPHEPQPSPRNDAWKSNPVLRRLVEEVRVEKVNPRPYDRIHQRHNRS